MPFLGPTPATLVTNPFPSDIFSLMARLPRVVITNVAHHVTQRGNARQVIPADDADCTAYLELLRQYCELYRLALLGYCMMSNHVHLIVVPRASEALRQTLKQTHGRYAAYWNARTASSGHVWQGRFYSCPLEESHLWAALRYVELNPVRAGMVAAAARWRWSSAPPIAFPALRLNCWTWISGASGGPRRSGGVSGVRRIGDRGRRIAALHAHRQGRREQRTRGSTRTGDFASTRSAKRRAPQKTVARFAPGSLFFCGVALGNWGTSRLSPDSNCWRNTVLRTRRGSIRYPVLCR